MQFDKIKNEVFYTANVVIENLHLILGKNRTSIETFILCRFAFLKSKLSFFKPDSKSENHGITQKLVSLFLKIPLGISTNCKNLVLLFD